MKTKPKVLVLKADGINRDADIAFAFTVAGGEAKIVHINELRTKNESLKNYHIIALPGGFSYGDDVASGKIQAIEMTTFFGNELKKFIERPETAIIGVCNGFQTLVRTGLLPFRHIGTMDATLTNNDSGHLECRWVNLRIEPNSRCVFLNNEITTPRMVARQRPRLLRGGLGNIVSYPVAHGEGKFFADDVMLKKIEKEHLVVFRYVDEKGNPTQSYPQNPNGALNAIGGICDLTGRILGLMPHPECFVRKEQHPNWRRNDIQRPHGLPLFENIVNFVKNA